MTFKLMHMDDDSLLLGLRCSVSTEPTCTERRAKYPLLSCDFTHRTRSLLILETPSNETEVSLFRA